MSAPASSPPSAQTSVAEPADHVIATAQGRLFARRWSALSPSPSPSPDGAALPPIVLFHDSLGCVDLWRDFPAVLCHATGREVIAYDRLGFGRSDARTGLLPRDFVAEEARTSLPALRAHFGVQRFVALGHSVGGGMAAHCAAARGGLADSHGGLGDDAGSDCTALITISAQACVEERTLQGIREARDQFRSRGAMDRLARYHGPGKARWVLNAWVDTWLHPDFADWSLAEAMARVTCPVLALHGDRDEYGSIEQPERIARWAAGPARVEILPGVGHVPHREQPAAVAALIAQCLDGLPDGCAARAIDT
ncbi:alpha/beta fold hydrolase [Acidovorax sp. NCPPB 3576]|uniref:alpha/beta fold hydrolase n=1 Tax=Acidovorax sp. NCPPB 3576 TaxID=2940488 RepID=UPI00234BA9DD|nr:alpha/beta hydrolase [Acidovorax sp. NCPPB 3576]WCM88695.1 alpha/beta hydrolase [Acidovorax sp. NCPPB 3576]